MKPESNKQTTYVSLETIKIAAPTVKVSRRAVKWFNAMADIHETEVGVLGFVDELPGNVYLIRDIFYPKHSEANGATCEISPEGETLMAEWLLNHGREDDVGKVKFWGHSHVNMGVSPSGQDEIQAMERMERTQSYFIRGIFNKDGKMSISFFDYQNKRRFDNVKWDTDEDEEDNQIRDKIKELKQTHLPATKNYTASGAGNSVYPHYGSSNYNQFDDEYWKNRADVDSFNNPASRLPYNDRQLAAITHLETNKKGKKKHKHSYVHEFAR